MEEPWPLGIEVKTHNEKFLVHSRDMLPLKTKKIKTVSLEWACIKWNKIFIWIFSLIPTAFHTVDISGIEMCGFPYTNRYLLIFILKQTNILVQLQSIS
jgi:hypothetical protein